jgi:hypothetical protein
VFGREHSIDDKIVEETEARLQERLQKFPVDRPDLPEVRKLILEQVKAEYQTVPPGYMRIFNIDLSAVKEQFAQQTPSASDKIQYGRPKHLRHVHGSLAGWGPANAAHIGVANR